MDTVERDYEFIDLAEEGGNQFLPKGIFYFGSVAVPEEQAVMEYIKFFNGIRPRVVYRGNRTNEKKFAYFMPYPTNGNGNHSSESEA